LIDEEMVGRMNNNGDVVELSVSGEVFVVVVSLVLTKRTLESRTRSLPTVVSKGGKSEGKGRGERRDERCQLGRV
jgi:hypothetical protein